MKGAGAGAEVSALHLQGLGPSSHLALQLLLLTGPDAGWKMMQDSSPEKKNPLVPFPHA